MYTNQQRMQYNMHHQPQQQHQYGQEQQKYKGFYKNNKHNKNEWKYNNKQNKNQMNKYNNKYNYNKKDRKYSKGSQNKNVEIQIQDEQQMIQYQKKKQVELQSKIDQLKSMIAKQKQQICGFFNQDNNPINTLNAIQMQMYNCLHGIISKQQDISHLQHQISYKQASIHSLQQAKKQFIKNQIFLTDYEDNIIKLQKIKQQIELMDNYILAHDLHQYQSELLEQQDKYKQQLLFYQSKNQQLIQQLQLRQLEQKVTKNKLVVLLAKCQQANSQQEQLKQTILSLQTHRNQIESRLAQLVKQKQQLANKPSRNCTLLKQIVQLQQEKGILQQLYKRQKQIKQKQIKQNEDMSQSDIQQLEEQLRVRTQQYRKIKRRKKSQKKWKRYNKLKQQNNKLFGQISILEQQLAVKRSYISQSQLKQLKKEREEVINKRKSKKQENEGIIQQEQQQQLVQEKRQKNKLEQQIINEQGQGQEQEQEEKQQYSSCKSNQSQGQKLKQIIRSQTKQSHQQQGRGKADSESQQKQNKKIVYFLLFFTAAIFIGIQLIVFYLYS